MSYMHDIYCITVVLNFIRKTKTLWSSDIPTVLPSFKNIPLLTFVLFFELQFCKVACNDINQFSVVNKLILFSIIRTITIASTSNLLYIRECSKCFIHITFFNSQAVL